MGALLTADFWASTEAIPRRTGKWASGNRYLACRPSWESTCATLLAPASLWWGPGVLVRATATEYHRLGGLKTIEMYVLQFWRLGCSRSRYQQIVWWGPASWFIDSCLLIVSPHDGQDKGAIWDLFYKAQIPFMKASLSWPHHLPKTPPSVPSQWGLGCNIWILKGYRHSVYSTRVPDMLLSTALQ